MIPAPLADGHDFDEWRTLARRLVAAGVPPDQVDWRGATGPADLFAAPAHPAPPARDVRASRAFLALARDCIPHTAPERLPLLYRTLWRLQAIPRLLEDGADPDIRALERMARAVRRDIHKMRAFVRFRVLAEPDGGDRYVAWFEPDHAIERVNARFFVDRFASQRWSILTPRLSLHWDGTALAEGPPARREDAPTADAAEALWTRYYRAVFNPARLKVKAMTREMPRKYWHNLPEAALIGEMVAGAQAREATMIAQGTGPARAAPPPDLDALATAIVACRDCPIGCNGTRAVPGEGPADAALMIVGEQPGDGEEREGRPFVGPAGQLLDTFLARTGIDRATTRLTNAVRHFKHTPTGKRRLHQNPTAGEIDRCRWWLDAERAIVRPRVVLALGASAARGLTGRTPGVARERGRPQALADGATLLLTCHPSYLLRLDGESRAREEARFARDLALAAELVGAVRPGAARAASDASAGSAW